MRNTDMLYMQNIFRLIEYVPSPKAEPLKTCFGIVLKEENKVIGYRRLIGNTIQRSNNR